MNLKQFVKINAEKVKRSKKGINNYVVWKDGRKYALHHVEDSLMTGVGKFIGTLGDLVKKHKITIDRTSTTEVAKSSKKVWDVLVVDRSGSMSSILEPVQKGINEYLQTLKRAKDEHKIDTSFTLIDFHSKETERVVIQSDMSTPVTYRLVPQNQTALFDAIKLAINTVMGYNPSSNDSVTVTIFTDGYENDSRTKREEIGAMIEQAKAKGWVFAWMGGGNLEAQQAAAQSININVTNVQNFATTTVGATIGTKTMNNARSASFATYATTGKTTDTNYFTKENT